MYRTPVSFILVLAVAVVMSSNAYAYTITFDDLEQPGSRYLEIRDYTTGLYNLTAPASGGYSGFRYAQQSNSYYNDSAAIVDMASGSNRFPEENRLHGLFSGFNRYFIPPAPESGALRSYSRPTIPIWISSGIQTSLPVSTTWTTLVMDSIFHNVHLVTWSQDAPYHEFDNIVLSAPDAHPRRDLAARVRDCRTGRYPSQGEGVESQHRAE